MNGNIMGVPCRLRTVRARKAVAQVLRQIRLRYPGDFERLHRKVLRIVPLSQRKQHGGTQGEWVKNEVKLSPEEQWQGVRQRDPIVLDALDGYPPGVIYLAEADTNLIALVAHELGHAATRSEDIKRRGDFSSDEWAHELAADWYAYRWGFGREIARDRKTRYVGHHLSGPNTRFSEECDGVRYHYRITRNLCIRLEQKTCADVGA